MGTYRINFVYQKMDLQGNIAYLWKKKIMMLDLDFRQENDIRIMMLLLR